MSTFGIIVSTRGFFPASLAEKGRKQILRKIENLGHKFVILPEEETRYGAVETFEDAQKYAKLFSSYRDCIDGIIVILPNFGDEVSVASTINMAQLEVPVLVQACDDRLDKMDLSNRRDAFCGKISVCNNLRQYNIKYTDTSQHTCDIDSEAFTSDIDFFSRVCSVVRGLQNTRIGVIGTRPGPFQTVRFSEKLLQASGITTCVVDMSEIIFAAKGMGNNSDVSERVAEIKRYGKIPAFIREENIVKQAKLSLVIEKWLADNRCVASAIQCWSSLQENYGCASCLTMSLMSEKGMPSACEADVMGALTMYSQYLASGKPSGYLDWNNNYNDERDKCINTHCSSFPTSFFAGDFEISNLDVLGNTLGHDRCFGACKGNIAPGEMTFAKITTDDTAGKIKAYVGEGEFTNDPAKLAGGIAVCSIKNLQALLKYICKNGFEHHVAMNRSRCADVLEEAFRNYMGWDVYKHM